jgi:hypothetical protein
MRKLYICYNFTGFIWIETTLSLWEEYALRAFENKMLMRIFGHMRDGEEWKRDGIYFMS